MSKEGVPIEQFDPKPAIKRNAEAAHDWEYSGEAKYLYGMAVLFRDRFLDPILLTDRGRLPDPVISFDNLRNRKVLAGYSLHRNPQGLLDEITFNTEHYQVQEEKKSGGLGAAIEGGNAGAAVYCGAIAIGAVWRETNDHLLMKAIFGDYGGLGSPRGLIGKDFERWLVNRYGGSGSKLVEGREFDNIIGDRWMEAKSGNYWQKFDQQIFQSDIGAHLRIAEEYGGTLEVHSNSPIPDYIKRWLRSRGIPFFEYLD